MNHPKTPIQGFPTRYAELQPQEDKDHPWTAAAARVYKALKKGGLIALYGNRGTGKTYMARDMANRCENYPDPWFPQKYADGTPINARPAIYSTAMMIFLQIRNTYRNDCPTSELDLMESWKDAALLVIDEIQERGESTFEDQKLAAIIDMRYQHNRPTILIANYATSREFAAAVSPSIASRMQENGGSILCDWPSFRATPHQNPA